MPTSTIRELMAELAKLNADHAELSHRHDQMLTIIQAIQVVTGHDGPLVDLPATIECTQELDRNTRLALMDACKLLYRVYCAKLGQSDLCPFGDTAQIDADIARLLGIDPRPIVNEHDIVPTF
jgi:hypothetical protein